DVAGQRGGVRRAGGPCSGGGDGGEASRACRGVMSDMTYTIHTGDCRAVLRTLDAESIDACVTDPPYGLSFMGKGWDRGVPGVEFWAEVLRVLQPGAHILAFGGS